MGMNLKNKSIIIIFSIIGINNNAVLRCAE